MQRLQDGAEPSTVYGGEHLLRLLLKLPYFLSLTSLTALQRANLETCIMDLVQYLQANSFMFFIDAAQYRNPPRSSLAYSCMACVNGASLATLSANQKHFQIPVTFNWFNGSERGSPPQA